MDLNQLFAFKAIARKENISQAARDLFISQQSLSRLLKQLEAELGVALFDRNGKHLKLNRYGEILLHYADIAGQALSTAQAELNEKQDRRKHAVRVIFRAQLGDTASLISSFMESNPQTQVHVNTENETNGDQDLELVRSDEKIDDPAFEYVCEDPWLLLVPNSSPLAQTSQTVKFEQLRGERFLFCSGTRNEEVLRKIPDAKRTQPVEIARFPQTWNVVNAIEQGIGISYGPATTWINSKALKIAALPLEGAQKTSFLYLHACKEQTAATKAFAEFLKLSLQLAEKRNRISER